LPLHRLAGNRVCRNRTARRAGEQGERRDSRDDCMTPIESHRKKELRAMHRVTSSMPELVCTKETKGR
ncbi:MAG TPA: hypothetical protein VKC52_09140, partial [Acidimicrobiia bacterium]|nr:hypothetical protein [Acidimicrobiia bacterium]